MGNHLSTIDTKYCCKVFKYFYPDTPTELYEYMWIPIKSIYTECMGEYNLNKKVNDD